MNKTLISAHFISEWAKETNILINNNIPNKKHHNATYSFCQLFGLAFIAMLFGATNFVEIEEIAEENDDLFKTTLKLEKIPSHDTINRAFRVVDNKVINEIFTNWSLSLNKDKLNHLALDGKEINSLNRHFEKFNLNQYVNQVSLYNCTNKTTISQLDTDTSKCHELRSMVSLINSVNIKSAVITADAMGTNKQLINKVVERKGFFVLPVKDNQANSADALKLLFNDQNQVNKLFAHEINHEPTKDKGFLVNKKFKVLSLSKLNKVAKSGLMVDCINDISYVISEMVIKEDLIKKTTKEYTRYFVTNLTKDSIINVDKYIKGHWAIENSLHWSLDVYFNEDKSNIHDKNCALNFNILRKCVLNTIKTLAPKMKIKKFIRLMSKTSFNKDIMKGFKII